MWGRLKPLRKHGKATHLLEEDPNCRSFRVGPAYELALGASESSTGKASNLHSQRSWSSVIRSKKYGKAERCHHLQCLKAVKCL